MTFYLDAGRYAPFLWSAYGLSAAVILALVVESVWRARRWRKAAEAREQAERKP
jgi:heme exporter protein D